MSLPFFGHRLLATALAMALLLALLTLAFNSQRAALEWIVSRQSGLVVSVKKLDSLRIGPSVQLSVTDVRAAGADLDLVARELSLEADTLALIQGRLEILNLVINGLELDIMKTGTADSGDAGVIPHISQWQISDSRISYLADDQSVDLALDKFVGNLDTDRNQLAFDIKGVLNSLPLAASGTTSGAGAGTRHVPAAPLNVSGRWGDLTITARGRPGDLKTGRDGDIELKVRAPDVRPLLEMLGIPEFRDGALDSESRLVDLGSTLNLQSRTAIGEFVVDVSGTSTDINAGQLQMSFEAAGPSLYEAGAVFDYLQFKPLPFRIRGSVEKNGSLLELHRSEINLAEGVLHVSARLPVYPSVDGLTMNLTGKGFSATILQPLLGKCELPAEPLDWRGELLESENRMHRFDLHIASEQHSVSIRGGADWDNGRFIPDLDIQTAGFTLTQLGACIGLENLPDVPSTFSTGLKRIDNVYHINEMSGGTRYFDLSGDVSIDAGAPETTIVADVTLSTDNLSEGVASLLPNTNFPFEIKSVPAAVSFAVSGSPTGINLQQADFSVGNAQGSLRGNLGEPGTMEGLDVQLSLSGDNLQTIIPDAERQSTEPRPFSLSAEISRRGHLWLFRRLDARVSRSHLSLTGQLSEEPGFPDSRLTITASGKNLENALGPWTPRGIPALPFRVSLDIDHRSENIEIKDMEAMIGDHHLFADLLIDPPPDFSASKGQIKLAGPSLHEILGILNQPVFTLNRPYDISLDIAGTADLLRLTDIDSHFGETDLSGSITLSNRQSEGPSQGVTVNRWFASAEVTSDSFFVPFLFPSTQQTGDPNRKKLFSSDPLYTDWLQGFDADISYRADRLWSDPKKSTRIELQADLVEGVARSRHVKWHGDSSIGEAGFRFDISGRENQLALEVRSSRLPLLWLLAGEAVPAEGTYYGTRLSSHGNSIADLVGNANGEMLFRGGGGRVDTALLDRLFGDFLQAVSAGITGDNSQSANVSCTAGALSIKDGNATLEPGLVIRTDRVDVFTGGIINLGSEQPDLGIYTRSRTGIGLSAAKVIAPRLKVTGSLLNPKINIDTRSTALSTGIAFFSGGLSVLANSLLDRVIAGAQNPCDALYEEALQQSIYKPLRRQPGTGG